MPDEQPTKLLKSVSARSPTLARMGQQASRFAASRPAAAKIEEALDALDISYAVQQANFAAAANDEALAVEARARADASKAGAAEGIVKIDALKVALRNFIDVLYSSPPRDVSGVLAELQVALDMPGVTLMDNPLLDIRDRLKVIGTKVNAFDVKLDHIVQGADAETRQRLAETTARLEASNSGLSKSVEDNTPK